MIIFRNSRKVTTKEIAVIIGFLTGNLPSNLRALEIMKSIEGKEVKGRGYYIADSELFVRYLKAYYSRALKGYKLDESEFEDIYQRASSWALDNDIEL